MILVLSFKEKPLFNSWKWIERGGQEVENLIRNTKNLWQTDYSKVNIEESNNNYFQE